MRRSWVRLPSDPPISFHIDKNHLPELEMVFVIYGEKKLVCWKGIFPVQSKTVKTSSHDGKEVFCFMGKKEWCPGKESFQSLMESRRSSAKPG
jgi:hypothetical protein